MGEIKNAYKILVGKSEGKRPLGRPGKDGKIILKWILGKQGGNLWTGLIWIRIGAKGGLLRTR
jgi:hypothetical protein